MNRVYEEFLEESETIEIKDGLPLGHLAIGSIYHRWDLLRTSTDPDERRDYHSFLSYVKGEANPVIADGYTNCLICM